MSKTRAVIIDRDGTLAQIDRSFVECDRPDWASFNAAIPFDNPVPAVVALANSISDDIAVIVCSGRNEDFRWPMLQWLRKHQIRCDFLYLRGSKDQRADEKVKRDILHDKILPNFDVLFAVDDRPSVCAMWVAEGIPLIQVAQPDHVPVFMGLGGLSSEHDENLH